MSFIFCSLLQLEPPLLPPRGEVNAADAFDIGSFDEDDTKKIKVSFGGHGGKFLILYNVDVDSVILTVAFINIHLYS